MSNMSYCRFENTASDLRDCLEALDNGEEISKHERKKGVEMFTEFLSFCADNGIVDDVDTDAIDNLFADKDVDNDEEDE